MQPNAFHLCVYFISSCVLLYDFLCLLNEFMLLLWLLLVLFFFLFSCRGSWVCVRVIVHDATEYFCLCICFIRSLTLRVVLCDFQGVF